MRDSDNFRRNIDRELDGSDEIDGNYVARQMEKFVEAKIEELQGDSQ